jgi:YggT family protein
LEALCLIGNLYLFTILARALMSWFPPTPGTGYAQVYSVIFNITEPVLAPLRRAIPPARLGMMAIDLSVLIVLIGGSILLRSIC